MDAAERRRLEAAYLATDYVVDDPRLRCLLAIDRVSTPLAQWLRAQGRDCAAFITAWNPRSLSRSEADNLFAQQQLRAAIHALDLQALQAVGRSRLDDYREPSLLVPGLPLEAAQALMRRFAQNAFLWCDAQACPRLHWTRF
jgi:hypothetical protein